MADNENIEGLDDPKGESPQRDARKDSKKDSKKDRRSFGEWIKHIAAVYKGEFERIVWPTREDLIKETFTVVVTSLLIGAIIATMDYAFGFGYRALVQWFGNLG